tara:strand:+ start:1203 stop:1730 length:528 start_codon:yes stop_codon:yes gene_type:complete
MIAWSKLELEIFDFLDNQKSKGSEDTARFFATSYHEAVTRAMDPFGNIVVLKSQEILTTAWMQVFATNFASPKDLKSAPYNFIGAAMIQYWTGNPVSPLIPHPGAVTGTVNVIVFPGNPVSLSMAIYNAFQLKDAKKVATDLVKAYQDHLSTTTGLFTGITPAPSPIVVPWIGLN